MNIERDDILKSIGFSDNFLKALHAFEQSVPEVELKSPLYLTEQFVKFDESSEEATVSLVNDNYNQNLIVKQD